MQEKPSRQAKHKASKDRKVRYNGENLDASFFKNYVSYDPESGNLYWIKNFGSRARAGAVAGNKSPDYVRVGIDGTHYLAHRLAWLMHTGSWPKEHIDHINGNKWDNRICNLRECTYALNAQNKVKRKTKVGVPRSKYIGVYWHKNLNKWTSTVTLNRKAHYVGVFLDEKEAFEAYKKKKAEIHEFKEVRNE